MQEGRRFDTATCNECGANAAGYSDAEDDRFYCSSCWDTYTRQSDNVDTVIEQYEAEFDGVPGEDGHRPAIPARFLPQHSPPLPNTSLLTDAIFYTSGAVMKAGGGTAV